MRQLKELLSFLVFQDLDDFADVLGALTGANEQRIRRINNHKVAHADGGDEFIWAPQEIAAWGIRFMPSSTSVPMHVNSPGLPSAPTWPFEREYLKSTEAFAPIWAPALAGICHEDAEFGHRLLAAGERLRYEPSAVVYHPAPEHRIQKDYFLKWWFDFGRASAREWGRGPSVLGIPRPYLNILNLGTIAMAREMGRWLLSLNPQRRFYYKCWVWAIAGRIKEYCRLLRATSLLPGKQWGAS